MSKIIYVSFKRAETYRLNIKDVRGTEHLESSKPDLQLSDGLFDEATRTLT